MSQPSLLNQLRQVPALSLTAGASLFLLFATALPMGAIEALQWDRAGLAGGQLWRLVTFHLVHPLFLDAFSSCIGLWIGWLVWRRTLELRETAWAALAIATVTSFALLADPRVLGPLSGASALIHGGLAYCIMRDVLTGRGEAALLGFGLIVKLGLEAFAPQVLEGTREFVSSDYAIAHRYAAITGVAIAALVRMIQSRRK